MGLSLADFCDLTPSEWGETRKAYVERENARYKDEWERMRMLGCILLQPNVKQGKKLKPTDIVRFDWDKSKEVRREVTDEEARKEIEEMKRKFGINC